MANKSAAERREALKKRTSQNIDNREKKGLGKSSIMDYSSLPEKVEFWSPRARVENLIDILPFIVTQEWYQKLRQPSGIRTELEVGDIDYKLEIPVHKNVGPENKVFVCLRLAFGKKCPLCEERSAEFEKDERDQDKTKIADLKPSWRNFYNIYDYDEPEKDIQIWDDMSFYLFEQFVLEEANMNEENRTFSDYEEGKSISAKFREKTFKKSPYFEASNIEFKERDPYPISILEETFSLDQFVHIPTYEEVLNAYLDTDEDTENIGTEDRIPEEKNTRRRPQRQRVNVETQKDDIPPADEGAPFDTCPHKGNFGADCQNLPECNEECPEETFAACADAQEKMGEEADTSSQGEKTRQPRQSRPPRKSRD